MAKLEKYDVMINSPSNDWDLYYWALGTKTVPDELDNDVFQLFKEFVKNKDKELRNQQPEVVKLNSVV